MHWNAVVAGTVIALATQILLTLLGIAVGAASFDVSPTDASDAATVGWVAYIWWTIAGIAAAFAGGWTAGNVSSAADESRFEGAFQGFTSR